MLETVNKSSRFADRLCISQKCLKMGLCVTWILEFMCIDSIFKRHVNNRRSRISCRKSMECIEFKTTQQMTKLCICQKKANNPSQLARMNSQSDDQRNQTRKMCLIWNRKLRGVYSFLRTGRCAVFSDHREKKNSTEIYIITNKWRKFNFTLSSIWYRLFARSEWYNWIPRRNVVMLCALFSSCANSECRSD